MTVFANNLEVSCKAQSNQIIAAFPDVCMTPPEAPPTPPGVPIPYPNFGMDSDTDNGTGTVKIGGKTINLKNVSYFTKTTGDEAGAAAKKGVVSSKNTGKSYSQAFSMNVKAEGKNLTRFSDISTNNHGSPPNVAPFPKIGSPNPPKEGDVCKDDYDKAEKACEGKDVAELCKDCGLDKKVGERADITDKDSLTHRTKVTSPSTRGATPIGSDKSKIKADQVRINKKLQKMSNKVQKDDCLAALACRLPEYGDGNTCPCPGQTGHHLVPASSFFNSGRGENPSPDEFPLSIHYPPRPKPADYKKPDPYSAKKAPVICAEGCSNVTGSHGMMHTEMKAFAMENAKPASLAKVVESTAVMERIQIEPDVPSAPYEDIRDEAIRSVSVVFPLSNCDPACLAAQLDAYHCDELGMKPDQKLRLDKPGRAEAEVPSAKKFAEARRKMLLKSK